MGSEIKQRLIEMIVSAITSKKAAATFAGLVVVIAGRLGIGLDEQETLNAIMLVASYVFGQGVADVGFHMGEGAVMATMGATFKERFQQMFVSAISSKKAWATVAGLASLLATRAGLDPVFVQKLIYLAMLYNTGQGIADAGKNLANVRTFV